MCNYIGRLNPNGSVDGSFNPGAGNVVNAVAQQGDGAIVAGGIFSTVGGGSGAATPRLRLARFATTAAATQSLALTGGGTVETWLRSGGGPEVSRVTFEFSFDGSFYSFLGAGSRIAGGWQFSAGPNLPSADGCTCARAASTAPGTRTDQVRLSNTSRPSMTTMRRSPTSMAAGRPTLRFSALRTASGTCATRRREQRRALDGGAQAIDRFPAITMEMVVLTSRSSAPRTAFGTCSSRATGTAESFQWGTATDLPVPGDYDGDGRTDYAVFRPSSGVWYIRYSGTGAVAITQWGGASDVPVPGDYNADGKADLGVFRPSDGAWYILVSGGGAIILQWGTANDIAVPGDYDGDGAEDIAVFRPSTGVWYVRFSSSGSVTILQWGSNNDTPVPGDFDGDGKTDHAVFRPSDGVWYIRFSSTGSSGALQWGVGTDIPILKRP